MVLGRAAVVQAKLVQPLVKVPRAQTRIPRRHACLPACLPARPPAEFLPHATAYGEAENLRKILKPETALVEGSTLDKQPTAAL